jgi:hypothetical protein
MNYEYKVVAFMGSTKGSQGADVVATQLTSLINSHATGGWELVPIGDLSIAGTSPN